MKKLKTASVIFSFIITSCGVNKTKDTNNKAINSIDFKKDYTLVDNKYGSKTSVTLKNGIRTMKTNAIPNHPTGTFPNPDNPNTISEQNIEYQIPVTPKIAQSTRWARQPGVAVNGIKFEPQTAERFVCETGEVYSVEAFQDILKFGLDSNNAHVQPTGAYHYHGVPTNLIKKLDKGEDIILVGYAMDGFPMYYSKSGKYKPSFKLSEKTRTGDVCAYNRPGKHIEKELKNSNPDGTFVSDWVYETGLGDLDECNGITIDGKYCYFITDTYPRIGRRLRGEFTEKGPKGPPPHHRGTRRDEGPPHHHHHKPDEEHNHKH